MQQRLLDGQVDIDFSVDPYADKRAAGRRLAKEFTVEEHEAFDLVLGFGSEDAARQALAQRWWRGEVEPREHAA